MSDILRDWLQRFNCYQEYKSYQVELRAARGAQNIRLLTEDEFDSLRWGTMAETERSRIDALDRRVNATESRIDGALGHLYGAEGRGGCLQQMERVQEEILRAVTKLDEKFDALILKHEQDQAHNEAIIAEVKTDVNRLGEKVRNSGASVKKFRDAGIVAAAGALVVGVLSILWRGLQELMGKL